MKIIAALLATLAIADDHGFPGDSSFHAGCHMSGKFTGTSCTDAKSAADKLI